MVIEQPLRSTDEGMDKMDLEEGGRGGGRGGGLIRIISGLSF